MGSNSGDTDDHHFHVLIVDDDPFVRKILERLLIKSAFQVTCVESVDQALEYLGLVGDVDDDSISSSSAAPELEGQTVKAKVNLIMTDYSLPGKTGYDLLRRVKKSPWKDIPVVVMSSENVPFRINMFLEGGAADFFLKPIQLSDLEKLQPHLLKSLACRCSNNK